MTELQAVYSYYARRPSVWVDRAMRPHSFCLLSGNFWMFAMEAKLVDEHTLTLARIDEEIRVATKPHDKVRGGHVMVLWYPCLFFLRRTTYFA